MVSSVSYDISYRGALAPPSCTHALRKQPRVLMAAARQSEGHGLLAIYVRLPGSPDLAQHLCSEASASSLRCRTADEDGFAAELERLRGKHGNFLLTTPTAPATVPSGAFYFVSLTNPLEALSASPLTSTTRDAPRRNPQCAALLPPGETANLAACTRLWTELSRRCNWLGDLRDARAHRVLVTALVERGGEAWRHARPPATAPFALAPFEPEPLRFVATALELEPLRERHAADYALYRWARKEHATCARGGRYVRGEDDTPPYTTIGRSHSTLKRLALGCAQVWLLRLLLRGCLAALVGPRYSQGMRPSLGAPSRCLRASRSLDCSFDHPGYTFEQASHTARFGYRHTDAATNKSAPMWSSWKNYSWVSDDCPSLHAPHDWCATLRGLRIVFVGDSTQYQAFLSLLGLLHAAEWASVGKDFQLDWKKTPPVQLCGDANTTVYFVRNDWCPQHGCKCSLGSATAFQFCHPGASTVGSGESL